MLRRRPPGPRTLRRSSLGVTRLYAGAVAAGLLLEAGLNYLANPWSLYPPRLLSPRILDDRSRKCGLLRRAQPPPQQVLLGSSRTVGFEAIRLEERTGLPSFNLAVPGAVPVDYLALYRFAAEEARAPVRSVIIGVETPSFCGHEHSYSLLEGNPDLRRFVPPRPRLVVDAYPLSLLLSWAQVRDSWASLCHAAGWASSCEPASADEPVGPAATERSPAQRGSHGRSEMRFKRAHLNPGELDPVAFRDLATLLRLLRERSVRVLVFATPTMDALREQWRRCGFIRQEESALRQIRSLVETHGGCFVDFSTVARFNGDPAGFEDEYHTTLANKRRMIDALFPPVGGGGVDASRPPVTRSPCHPVTGAARGVPESICRPGPGEPIQTVAERRENTK
jgi:hypothetical protein